MTQITKKTELLGLFNQTEEMVRIFHVAGAINIPLDDLSDKLATLPKHRPVVTYCNMHHPGQSCGEKASALLAENGYHAAAVAGGYPASESAGLPTESD